MCVREREKVFIASDFDWVPVYVCLDSVSWDLCVSVLFGNLFLLCFWLYSSELHSCYAGVSTFNQMNIEMKFSESTKPKRRWMVLVWPILRCWNDSSGTNGSLTSRYTHTHTHSLSLSLSHSCSHSLTLYPRCVSFRIQYKNDVFLCVCLFTLGFSVRLCASNRQADEGVERHLQVWKL